MCTWLLTAVWWIQFCLPSMTHLLAMSICCFPSSLTTSQGWSTVSTSILWTLMTVSSCMMSFAMSRASRDIHPNSQWILLSLNSLKSTKLATSSPYLLTAFSTTHLRRPLMWTQLKSTRSHLLTSLTLTKNKSGSINQFWILFSTLLFKSINRYLLTSASLPTQQIRNYSFPRSKESSKSIRTLLFL